MKEWLKKNTNNIIGNFFIWIVPMITILTMSFGGTKTETTTKFKFSLIGIVIALIYLIIYSKKIKKLVERRKTIQIAQLNRVKFWVRLVEWISYMLPYTIILVLFNALSGVYEQVFTDLMTFIVITMVSATIGYIFLMLDTKEKKE